MDELYSKILKDGYGIKLYNGIRTRTGFVCKTNQGAKEIRKVSNDISRLISESELRNYIKKRGFIISTFQKRENGDFFYELNGTKYVLEESLQGNEMDFSNFSNACECAKTLAFFHNCTEGFKYQTMKNDAQKMIYTFQKRNLELNRIRKRIKESRKYSSIDLVIIENFETVSNMISKSLSIIEKHTNKNINQKYIVCHNSFKGDNIRLLENGKKTVTNLDKCSYNFNVADVSDFLRRLIKTELLEFSDIYKILNSYKEIRNINENEKNILKALLIFPQKFLTICNEYYNKRSVCISEAMLERFEKSAILIKKNYDFAQNL